MRPATGRAGPLTRDVGESDLPADLAAPGRVGRSSVTPRRGLVSTPRVDVITAQRAGDLGLRVGVAPGPAAPAGSRSGAQGRRRSRVVQTRSAGPARGLNLSGKHKRGESHGGHQYVVVAWSTDKARERLLHVGSFQNLAPVRIDPGGLGIERPRSGSRDAEGGAERTRRKRPRPPRGPRMPHWQCGGCPAACAAVSIVRTCGPNQARPRSHRNAASLRGRSERNGARLGAVRAGPGEENRCSTRPIPGRRRTDVEEPVPGVDAFRGPWAPGSGAIQAEVRRRCWLRRPPWRTRRPSACPGFRGRHPPRRPREGLRGWPDSTGT